MKDALNKLYIVRAKGLLFGKTCFSCYTWHKFECFFVWSCEKESGYWHIWNVLPQVADFLEGVKWKKVVLIHGEGFGAWCWYKTIVLLEEVGLIPTAIDLTGSGIDTTDTNSVSTLAEYSKPLIDYMQNLPEDEKVQRCIIRFMSWTSCFFFLFQVKEWYCCFSQAILVGHSIGGACVSYALEQFPEKIAKAIYICGTMVANGRRPFDVFAEEVCTNMAHRGKGRFPNEWNLVCLCSADDDIHLLQPYLLKIQ